MGKTVKQLDDDILMSRLAIKLCDYAQEIIPQVMNGKTIEGITMKHSQYILSYLREHIQKDYGHGS